MNSVQSAAQMVGSVELLICIKLHFKLNNSYMVNTQRPCNFPNYPLQTNIKYELDLYLWLSG